MGITFRDESNKPSSTMIGYSDATATMPNQSRIMRSKDSLATVLLQYYSRGVSFIIIYYLISLISGKRAEKFSEKFYISIQTRPFF